MIDILLSIPIISYIFSPASGASLSTSINILFFYMTWTSLVLSHQALRLHVFGVLVIRVLFWLVPSLIFLLFDLGLPSLSTGFKYGGESALPPRDPRKLGKVVALAVVNLLIMLAVEAGASALYTLIFKGSHVFRMSTTLPLPWTVFKHWAAITASRELLQYYVHRYVLHGSSWLAKKHVAYAHSKPGAPFSLQLFTDFPVAQVLHRFLPTFLPALIVRPHLLTYFTVIITSTIEETLAMSGYTFVPGVMMSGITQRTAIHYASKGSANFGAWGITDWAHGTSKGRGVLDDVRAEADKHQVQERSAAKVDEGTSVFQNGVEALTKNVKARVGKQKSSK